MYSLKIKTVRDFMYTSKYFLLSSFVVCHKLNHTVYVFINSSKKNKVFTMYYKTYFRIQILLRILITLLGI